MTEELKPYEVLYDYSDVPTIRRFALDNTRMRCLMGPFGCIDGDTKVFTAKGLVRISDIGQPTHVLTWNGKRDRFQLSLSGGAFPKGRDYLYRISTQQGEFVAAGHHRVLCGDNMYRRVDQLQYGSRLLLCSSGQRLKSISTSLLSLPEDGLCFDEKIVDSMGHYAESARLYGQRLLREEDSDRVSFQGQDDARRLFLHSDGAVSVLKDNQVEPSPEHIRRGLSSVPIRIDGSLCPVGHLDANDQVFSTSQPSEHTELSVQRFLRFLLRIVPRRIVKLFSPYSRSYSSSLTEWPILSIGREDVKKIFWDMQVLGTNNYVTLDGTIHHNSGKSSGCVMEDIRRAHEQTPGPDGIRRTRSVVVRNSYGQLKDTTIKTFHDWFPPRIFGEWRVTDHTYIFTKFPGIHHEVIFRALDRPDQVSNLLSLEVTWAWFNEVREIPWTIIEAMDSRIGRYPSKRDGGASWLGMFMDTNPPDDGSRLYQMAEKIKPDTFKMFKQPSGLSTHAENTKHLPKNYYQNLAKGKDEMYIRIYIHGQYGYLVSGKPVFLSFRDNVHVAPHPLEPMKGVDVLVGLDFGLQPACVIGQLTPLGQLRILDELVSDGMGIRQFCENQLIPLLRQKYFGMNVMGFGDPSGVSRAPTDESTCFEVLHSKDIGLSNIIEAPTNAIMPRVGAVEFFLNKMYAGEPGFVLSPNCHFIRKAMNGAYHYDKDPKGSGDEYKPMPVKNFASHVADALEYLCMYVVEHEAYDKQRKSFLANLKQKKYNPVSDIAGY